MKKSLLFGLPLLVILAMPVTTPAQEPSGFISAEPNPCRIRPGEEMCVAHVTWSTQNVGRAKVFVISEGRDQFKEKEFGSGLVCESRRCRAPWIRPHTRYIFKLVDFTRGDRGRELAAVTVTGEREE